MRTRLIVTMALVVLPGPGCGHVIDPPEPPRGTPLIQAVLVAGREAVVQVDLLRSGENVPVQIDPIEVDLTLVDEAGARTPLVPDSRPGEYRAATPIEAGIHYRLEGSVAGVPVSAETRIPLEIRIVTPTGDTIIAAPLEPTEEFGIAAVPFTWSAPGATAFLLDSATFTLGSTVTRATAGHFSFPRRAAGSPPGPRIRILALNGDADGYLNGRSRPLTNVRGGFGVLGGAIEAHRVVVWR